MALSAVSASSFTGVRVQSAAPRRVNPVASKGPMVVRAGGFIGSETNVIMCVTTGLVLAAGRFGLAPTANRLASAGLKLTEKKQGQLSGDPSGYTASDVLYGGTVGHILGVGIVLGLRATGNL